MAAPQNFRSAFNGFNREDVVHYLEYLNSKHQTQINQLNEELDLLRADAAEKDTEELEALRAECGTLREQLEAAESARRELEERCAALETKEEKPEASQELDAYHRAENIERESKMRAELVYFQVNGVLGEANAKMGGVASEITELADQAMRELTKLQVAVSESKHTLQDAADLIKSIRPN